MNVLTTHTRSVFAFAALMIISACGGGGGDSSPIHIQPPDASTPPGTGTVGLMLTDMPNGDFSQVVAEVRSVALLGRDEEIVIFSVPEGGPATSVDLLALENFNELFAIADGIPAGTYDRIRLVLDGVTLYETQEATGLPVQLPDSGAIDIKPREKIIVGTDGMLMLELDIDATKSIKVVKGKGETAYRLLPVIAVDVSDHTDDAIGTKLTWIHGDVSSIDPDNTSLVVCQKKRRSDPGGASTVKDRCVTIASGEQTSIFLPDGGPGDLAGVSAGDPLTVIGRLSVETGTAGNGLVLEAFVIELGELGNFDRLNGTVDTPLDTVSGEFGIAVSAGQMFDAASNIKGLVQAGTRIFDTGGNALAESALQVGVPGEFEGVFVADTNTLRTSWIIIDPDARATQSISGTITSVEAAQNTFMLMTTPSDQLESVPIQVCVYEQTEITLVTLTDTDTLTQGVALGDLAADMGAEVFGVEDSTGCFEAEAVRAEDDQRTEDPVNRMPVANAGPDQSVTTGESVMLDGSRSEDPDGDALVYRWSLAVPTGSSATLDDSSSVMPAFTTDVDGDYVAELTVSDGASDSLPDAVTVTAAAVPEPANNPPTAAAGPDQSVEVGDTVTLSGSGTDVDGDPLTFQWTLMPPAGSMASLSGADTATPGFTADVEGDYTLELVVNDGTVDSDPDQLVVTATAPPPTLDGAGLYADNCAGCHGQLERSEYRGASASAIQRAIDQNKGGMGRLSFLTPEEVQAIADALAN